ncbi:MAG TPA: hypothetical protein ENH43_02015 [Phycisphaerales bacterium]|nr:hypothetical protein [Phycisphaerales bacterium]
MIIYNPTDGDAFTTPIKSTPKHCFLMTRLGKPVPKMVKDIGAEVKICCRKEKYIVIDAGTRVSGRDFLIKIWKMIASSPIAVGVVHESIPAVTQANIFYELGVAQALGKETLIVKSPKAQIPSDFIRTEYITFDAGFTKNFLKYIANLKDQAEHYEIVADQLDRNPILAIDYLKRAYLITGESRLRKKVKAVVQGAGLQDRAANSVELLAAAF